MDVSHDDDKPCLYQSDKLSFDLEKEHHALPADKENWDKGGNPNVAGDSGTMVVTPPVPDNGNALGRSERSASGAAIGASFADAERERCSRCSTPTLDEEAALFEAIDNMITKAEERELLEELDRPILADELKELLGSVSDRIGQSELMEPAPLVDRVIEVDAGPAEDFFGMTSADIESLEFGGPKAASLEPERDIHELFSSELVKATKVLPKFFPRTNTLILTSKDLQFAVNKACHEAKEMFPGQAYFYCTAEREILMTSLSLFYFRWQGTDMRSTPLRLLYDVMFSQKSRSSTELQYSQMGKL